MANPHGSLTHESISHHRKVFLIGPGFLGWNVLDTLVAEGYTVRALVRNQDSAKPVTASNAEAIIGGLEDAALITKHTLDSDVVIHTAAADDVASAQAVLEGIKQRAEKELPTIYLHTSGAAMCDDGANGNHKGDKIYFDDKPGELDALPDSALHRHVDSVVLKAKKEIGKKAKIAIIVPPLVYGFWPQNPRLSVQVPMLARFALKHGFAGYVGKGLSVVSAVHVRDLARGYVTVLHHLEKTSGSDPDLHNPWYFVEATGDEEPSWLEMATVMGKGFNDLGFLSDPEPRSISEDMYKDLLGPMTGPILGMDARCRAHRVRKLGWKPTHKDWRSSLLEDEIPAILREQGYQ